AVAFAAPTWKPEDGSAVLDATERFLRRFVVLSPAQSAVVSLWAMHTHAIAATDVTPYLWISSAEKESGKTRLLEALELIVKNPWLTGHASAAVLYRKIDKFHPTVLLDETDAAFGGDKDYSEALRGVLNTGYLRNGRHSVCVGPSGNLDLKDFSTFAA